MPSYHRVVGIDLGTTYSVVAAYDHDKHDVKVLPNQQNERTTPSVIHIGTTGQISVGRAAKEKLARDPAAVVFQSKRIMGERTPTGGKAMVVARGTEYDPEFVAACILKELKQCAEKLIGAPVHDAVITVPQYFLETQKNATKEAAKIARLNPLAIINEPTAAAIAYGLEKGEPQTFIVYDFGGGTFDVSIVRIQDERTAAVLGTGGDRRLGGADIDQRMVDWVLRRLQREHGADLSQDARLVGKLRLRAEQLKIDLSNQAASQEFVVEAPVPGVAESVYDVAAADFEEMCRPILERTLPGIDAALASAAKEHRLTLDEVDAFVLVGGSSKLPAVRRLLEDRYKKPVRSDLNPDEIVAIGAARYAASFVPSMAPEITDEPPRKDRSVNVPQPIDSSDVKDVVSHTLGIGLLNDVFDPLIEKDHVVPHRIVRDNYATAHDNQTGIFVPVYQGDAVKASLNTLIGRVVIDGLTPEPKGAHQFQVTFALDSNGLFEGAIKHLKTGAVTPIKLDRDDLGLTHKQRVKLAELLDAGRAPVPAPAAAATNMIDVLVKQAHDLISELPVDRQRTLRDAVSQVLDDRVNNRDLSRSVAQLTLAVSRNRA